MTDSDNAVPRGGDEHAQGAAHTSRRGIKITTWSFQLGFGPFTPTRGNDTNYASYLRLKTAPPGGCVFREDYGFARLECKRPGPSRFAAIGQLVREIRTVYGLVGTDDLGIEKLWEWIPGDREWAESTAGQLLLMGATRADKLGIGVEDVVTLVRDAMAPPLMLRHAADRPAPGTDAGSAQPEESDDPEP